MATIKATTKKPPKPVRRSHRVALSVPPDAHAALVDLASASKRTVTGVITEILVEVAPELHGVAKLIRLTNAGKHRSARKVLRHLIGDAAATMVAASQSEMFPESKK